MAAGLVAGDARTMSPLGRANIANGCRPASVNAGKKRVSVCASLGHRSRARRRALAASRAASFASVSASRSSSFVCLCFFTFL